MEDPYYGGPLAGPAMSGEYRGGSSFFMDTLDAVPSLPQQMAITAARGSRTIVNGGNARRSVPQSGYMRGAMQNFGRGFSKYNTQDVFFRSRGYTPFAGAQGLNAFLRKR